MNSIFLVYNDSKSSAGYRRYSGIVKLIDYTLDTKCELISVGAIYNNQTLSKKRFIRFTQKCILEFKHYFRVKKIVKTKKPDLIYSTFIGIHTMKWLKKYCLKHRISLYNDFCEWCIPGTFKLGRFSPGYRKNHYAMSKWVDHNVSASGITRCITDHLIEMGANGIRLPNLTDYSLAEKDTFIPSDKLELFFVGNKSKRDNCDRVIDALYELNEVERKKIHVTFTACGFFTSHNAHTDKAKYDELLKEGVITEYSYLPLEEYKQKLSNSDFTVFFFCSNDRNANAGFPTRLMDSSFVSVPAISNLANDLELFLIDNVNSLVADGYEVKDIVNVFRRALSLTKQQRLDMRKEAFKLGLNNFDYRVYKNDFIKFIEAGKR